MGNRVPCVYFGTYCSRCYGASPRCLFREPFFLLSVVRLRLTHIFWNGFKFSTIFACVKILFFFFEKIINNEEKSILLSCYTYEKHEYFWNEMLWNLDLLSRGEQVSCR
uniref:Uncharacterized protein n=1 Tax=Cacopsylla melanoneura TaxID=428564 RepID=A0A8D8VNC4_9HEMI